MALMATRRVMSAARFESKATACQHAWDLLADQGLARFPFPPHGRIPNFKGARTAAERLFREAPWVDASAIKVNPDSPQKWVRQRALELGIRVYVPTPKLAGGFHLLDPELIPPQCYGDAATLKTMTRFSVDVTLAALPQVDAMVSGCAAVTRTGKRCGKGAGYSDIEYALLLELGHEPVPVATTVHDVQVVDDFPVMSNDLPLALIATPTQTIRVARALTAPSGIDWSAIDAKTVDAMPPLQELLDNGG
jgi:5-formyltetrahydrofolate cyclo-ligase|tara:strand:+ start:3975 stop:4724 length:750 start_codon:yes stop_codon:yes gene_type:complete